MLLPATIALRRATPDDAPALADLNAHVQRLHADAHPDQFSPVSHSAVQAFFDTALAGGPDLAWIAEIAEEPIGYLYAVEAHRDANPFTTEQHTLHVHHLAVAPTARRCGVGSSLLRAVVGHARDAGLDGLLLDSWTFNAEAHAFFRRFGFEPMQTRFALRL
ncbi:GNAT family N-acetyltransferase [Kineococcus endophyticus]|uniref:GNAT family N-acetyltransferase n=1 Tax=Kineococcus endophyticus TaxID=1181883 RepID=A0ABV3PC16_9ACTN